MGKKSSEKLSESPWKELWRAALKAGKCPKGCDIRKKTCDHLDRYLDGKSVSLSQYDLVDAERLRQGATSYSHTQGVWALFKRLRRYGLAPIQIRILIRWKALKQNRRQVMRELKIHSVEAFYNHYRTAVNYLKVHREKI